MNTKKVKSGQYYRAVVIVLADYLQNSLQANISRCDDKDEMEFLAELAVNARSLIKRDGGVNLRFEESLDLQKKKVLEHLEAVENEALSALYMLDLKPEMGVSGFDQILNDGEKVLTAKLFKKLNGFIAEVPNLCYKEFRHGLDDYRLILTDNEKKEYELMISRPKDVGWYYRASLKVR